MQKTGFCEMLRNGSRMVGALVSWTCNLNLSTIYWMDIFYIDLLKKLY